MKRLPLVIMGLVGVAAVLGFGAWQILKLDTSQDGFVAGYRKNFAESCVVGAEKSIVASGGTVDEKRKAELGDICACGADVSVAELQARGPMSMGEMMDLQNSPEFVEKIGTIMTTCRQKFSAL